jgi:hypothetical protein
MGVSIMIIQQEQIRNLTRRAELAENRLAGLLRERETAHVCVDCGGALPRSERGRPRRFCSLKCRVRFWRRANVRKR